MTYVRENSVSYRMKSNLGTYANCKLTSRQSPLPAGVTSTAIVTQERCETCLTACSAALHRCLQTNQTYDETKAFTTHAAVPA